MARERRHKRPVAPGLAAGERGERSNTGRRPFFFSPVARDVTVLALPIAIGLLGEVAMGLIDTRLVSGLGKDALGGVGVAITLMFTLYTTAFGFMRGVKVRVAHAVGAGNAAGSLVFAQVGVMVGLVGGALAFLITRDVTPFLAAIGIGPDMSRSAAEFLAARAYGAPAIFVVSALVQYRQALGDARVPMMFNLGANVLNAVAAWSLIHGHFGLPALGVAGAGYGTALADWAQAIGLSAFCLAKAPGSLVASPTRLREALREVAELGLPTGAQFGLEMLAISTFTAILGGMGSAEMAAHQIAMMVLRTSFLPGVAIAEACSVLVGTALGAGDGRRARTVTYAAIVIAASFMSACGVGLALFGGEITRLFTDDESVRAVARRLFLVAALFQTVDAITIVLRGALRGAKDVRVVAAVGVFCVWTFVPVSAYVLGRVLGMGAVGGWFGFLFETSVAATLLGFRFARGSFWKKYAAATATPVAA